MEPSAIVGTPGHTYIMDLVNNHGYSIMYYSRNRGFCPIENPTSIDNSMCLFIGNVNTGSALSVLKHFMNGVKYRKNKRKSPPNTTHDMPIYGKDSFIGANSDEMDRVPSGDKSLDEVSAASATDAHSGNKINEVKCMAPKPSKYTHNPYSHIKRKLKL
jgi:hypothetical protein